MATDAETRVYMRKLHRTLLEAAICAFAWLMLILVLGGLWLRVLEERQLRTLRSADPTTLLQACRQMMRDVDKYQTIARGDHFSNNPRLYAAGLNMAEPKHSSAVPLPIQRLGARWVWIGEDYVEVQMSALSRVYLRAFADGLWPQSGTQKLTNGLWMKAGRAVYETRTGKRFKTLAEAQAADQEDARRESSTNSATPAPSSTTSSR